MRIFSNDEGKQWDKNVVQKNYEILIGIHSFTSFASTSLLFLTVSQFTLYGKLKGYKPDFHLSSKSDHALPLYKSVIQKLQQQYKKEAVKGVHFECLSLNRMTNCH